MLPTSGTKLNAHALLVHQNDVLPPGDVADLSDLDTSNAGRDALAARGREEKFVIFATVQGGLKIDFVTGGVDGGEGYGVGPNFRAYSTLLADMGEVGGKAVTDVDHGRGQALLAQELSDGEAGLRVKVLREVSWTKFAAGDKQFQCSRRASEGTGHIDAVARFRARAQYGFALRAGSDDDDIGEDSSGRLGNVAAGEGHLKHIGLVQQAAEKPVNPALRQISRQGQREKCGDRPPSHGSNVTQAASEAAMADNFGGMPLSPEMDALQTEIGGDQCFVSGRDSHGGAVVPDADADGGATFCAGAHSLDDRFFA
jgi:hypothetical protein